jgi:orotidine-5'-phosphate decarboxylase
MGKDSVEPFLAFENKHTIMLALTSNEGAFDFQTLFRRKRIIQARTGNI